MTEQDASPARVYLLLSIIIGIGLVVGTILIADKMGKIKLPGAANPITSILQIF